VTGLNGLTDSYRFLLPGLLPFRTGGTDMTQATGLSKGHDSLLAGSFAARAAGMPFFQLLRLRLSLIM